MDPLSLTLAVISLTTAVKGLVDFAKKIHDSFDKVSDNHRNAKRVAGEIEEMLEEIRGFCEDHLDALNNMKEFRVALQGLLAKFRSFETSIIPLLQTGGRRRDRFIRGWDAWRNNSKIEANILSLQTDILKVMRRYMMSSAMRTETKLEALHQDTKTSFASITQGLEVVQRDMSALRIPTATNITHSLHESLATTSDIFDNNIVVFARTTLSSSAPMLRIPNVITEELMTAAYIKLQINHIAMTVENISKSHVLPPHTASKFYLTPVFEQTSMDITHIRHHVVRDVTHIRDLLDGNTHTISIYTGAGALNELAVGLETLGMGQESILVGSWAITITRSLLHACNGGQPYLDATLAQFLLNQSARYVGSGDKIKGLQAIKEAHTITQNLRSQFDTETRFQTLHANVLLLYAGLVDTERSIEMSFEAVQVLKIIFNVEEPQVFDPSIGQISSSFLNRLFASAPTIPSITTYAQALQSLGDYLAIDGNSESALDLQILAIAMRQKIVSDYGHKYKPELAMALSSLVRGGTSKLIPPDHLISMIDECIKLLRELADKNPLPYARQMVLVLWEKAETLGRLNRVTEAIAIWEEVVSLTGQIVRDSEMCASALDHLSLQFRRLRKHEDAVRTGMEAITTRHDSRLADTQSLRYLYLSMDLHQLRRYKQSAEAAQVSVALYRHLTMKDPGKWRSHLTAALSNLAHCMAALGDYPEALIAWRETISILVNLLGTTTDGSSVVIRTYLLALDKHPLLSIILKGEEECLQVCSTAVQCLRQLFEIYQRDARIIVTLLRNEFFYAYNMVRVGRLQEALQYLDHWSELWSKKPQAIPKFEIARWDALMASLKAAALDEQGSTEQALLITQRVHDAVPPSLNSYVAASDVMIRSMIQEAHFRLSLSTGEAALQISKRALQLSRKNKQALSINSLIWSLHGLASAALSCGSYTQAVEAAREGCAICTRPNWQDTEGEHNIFLRPSLFAILSCAEANLGMSRAAVDYAQRAFDASLDIRDRKSDISATTAEQSYMETRGNLANILLFTGSTSQALQICEERRSYFSKRVERRMGEYRELAPILHILGILYCGEGRHEEGDAAAKELSHITTVLGSAFPSLQEQVKIRLRTQAKMPILKVLHEMSQKLNCGHQAEVAIYSRNL